MEENKFFDFDIASNGMLEAMSSGDGSTLKERVAREAEAVEIEFASVYKLLPDTDPIVFELQHEVERLFPGEGYRVCVLDDVQEANALSLPNGLIMVTRGLLRFIESWDELRFVLAHEGVHIRREHALESANVFDRLRPKHALATVGMLRFHEYEADVRAIFDTAGIPFQLSAVRRLLLRFHEQEKGNGGLIHGSSLERVINIGAVARMKDLGSHDVSEEPLTEAFEKYRAEQLPQTKLDDLAEALIAGKRKAFDAFTLSELGRLLGLLRTKPSKLELTPLDQAHDLENLDERFHATWASVVETVRCRCLVTQKNQAAATLHERWFWQGLVGYTQEELSETPSLAYLAASEPMDVKEWKKTVGGLLRDPAMRPESSSILSDLFRDYLVQRLEEEEDVRLVMKEGKKIRAALTEAVSEPHERRKLLHDCQIDLFEQGFLSLNVRALDFETRLTELFKECIADVERNDREELAMLLFELAQEQLVKIRPAEKILKLREAWLREFPLASLLFHGSDAYKQASGEKLVIGHDIFKKFNRESDNSERVRDKVNAALHKTLHDELSHVLANDENMLEMLRKIEAMGELLQQRLLKSKREIVDDGDQSNGERFLIYVLSYIDLCCRDHVNERFESGRAWENLFCRLRLLKTDFADKILYEAIDAFPNEDDLTQVDLERLYRYFQILEGSHPGLKALDNGRGHGQFAPPDDEDGFFKATLVEAIAGLFFAGVSNLIKNGASRSTVLAEVKRFLILFLRYNGAVPFVWGSSAEGTLGEDAAREEVEQNQSQMTDFCTSILKKFSFDPAQRDDANDLLAISHFIADPIMRFHWQNDLLECVIARMPSGLAGLRFCLEDEIAAKSANLKILDRIIEFEISRPSELHEAHQRVLTHLEGMLQEEWLGAKALLDFLPSSDKPSQLDALLDFSDDDSEIKYKVFAWKMRKIDTDETDPEIILKAMLETEQQLDRLAMSDEWIKYGLLRHLLVGRNGLLLTASGRKAALLSLLARSVSAESPEEQVWRENIREIVGTVAEVTDPDQLFLSLVPLIQRQILGKSRCLSEWEKVLKRFRIEKELVKDLCSKRFIMEHNSDSRIRSRSTDSELKALMEENGLQPIRSEFAPEKMTVEQFFMEVARNLGTPGTRFLQIMGQYLELPPRLQLSMQDVYDRVPGQSKLTAAETIRREWSGTQRELLSLTERIGGGSLFSAYSTETREKMEIRQEVVKVLAPNARAQNSIAFEIIERVASTLAKRSPEVYGSLPFLVDDLREWIEGDLHDPDFMTLDLAFRTTHDGFTLPGSSLRIHIPKTFDVGGRDNPYVKREEFIRGQTLNRWIGSEIEQREVVELLTASFFNQVQDGLVHSDLHPGNVIRTENGELALIDRHHYLVLTEQEKEMVTLFYDCLNGGSPFPLVRVLDPQIESDSRFVFELQKEIQILFEKKLSLGSMASGLMQLLRQRGLRMPINMTLLLKNLLSLNRMAQKAGFADLQAVLVS